MDDIKAKLDAIRAMMDDPRAIEGVGLSNEENIRIYGYAPEDEPIVRHFTEKLRESPPLRLRPQDLRPLRHLPAPLREEKGHKRRPEARGQERLGGPAP